jgi:hypothetical protein
MNNMTKLEELRKQIKKLQAEQIKLARSGFEGAIKDIFVHHPKLKSFAWRQFHPWNDGEPTYFSACIDEDCLTINGYQLDDLYKSDSTMDIEHEDAGISYNEGLAAANEIAEALSSIEDCLEEMFDDSSEITVTPKGVKVESYYE